MTLKLLSVHLMFLLIMGNWLKVDIVLFKRIHERCLNFIKEKCSFNNYCNNNKEFYHILKRSDFPSGKKTLISWVVAFMMFFILIILNCIIQAFQFCNTFGVLKDKGEKCFSFISDLQKSGKDVFMHVLFV